VKKSLGKSWLHISFYLQAGKQFRKKRGFFFKKAIESSQSYID
jgi:hypothetical protein